MGDQGLFALATAFEKIHQLNTQGKFSDYEETLELNIAENIFTDNGVKILATLLGIFGGISKLDMSDNPSLNPTSFNNLMNAMTKNFSVRYLNYSLNKIDEQSLQLLNKCVSVNYVLTQVDITVPEAYAKLVTNQLSTLQKFFRLKLQSAKDDSLGYGDPFY